MATDVFVGHFLQLIVVTALVTRVSASQITVLDGFTGVEQCDVKCTAEFADSKVSCAIVRSSITSAKMGED